MRTIFLALSLIVGPLQLAFSQPAIEAQFQEAMDVCDNMTLYVDSAKRQRGMGMPLDEAKQNVVRLMQRNLKLPEAISRGSIDLAVSIYEYVYAQELLWALSTERVLYENCGTYRGYELPASRVKEHVLSTTQSAWDPLARVPLCTKVAQSLSNIASGRDRGIPLERMTEVATTSLADDLFTSERLPVLLAWAYDKPALDVGQLYAYALRQCTAEQTGKKYPELKFLRERLVACVGHSQKSEQEACTLQALRGSE